MLETVLAGGRSVYSVQRWTQRQMQHIGTCNTSGAAHSCVPATHQPTTLSTVDETVCFRFGQCGEGLVVVTSITRPHVAQTVATTGRASRIAAADSDSMQRGSGVH